MRASLVYGRRYRAQVALPPQLRAIVTPEMLTSLLQRYQLFGRVSESRTGYEVLAEFRGRSGTYDLPAEVESVELLS